MAKIIAGTVAGLFVAALAGAAAGAPAGLAGIGEAATLATARPAPELLLVRHHWRHWYRHRHWAHLRPLVAPAPEALAELPEPRPERPAAASTGNPPAAANPATRWVDPGSAH